MSFSPESDRNNPHNLESDRETIYSFLIEIVNQETTDKILKEFKCLFVLGGQNSRNDSVVKSLNNILSSDREDCFRSTLKRCCYILINNWLTNRQYSSIQKLIKTLDLAIDIHQKKSIYSKNLSNWLYRFIHSEDYQEIQIFASFGKAQKSSWSQRYTSYLLVPHYLDSKTPIEQREIARKLSQKLKLKFKFDLATYIARYDRPTLKKYKIPNPTNLKKDVISLIKQVVPRHVSFSLQNYAYRFNKEIEHTQYASFKQGFQNYLFFSFGDKEDLQNIQINLNTKLNKLYPERDQDALTFELFLRTCKRVINFFTLEKTGEPSSIFVLLNTQENRIILVIILLKIILICNYTNSHLEVQIAQLIRYYENSPEKDCQWFVDFLDIFKVVFAIYTGNIEYSLVKIKDNNSETQTFFNLDNYRLFPQFKGAELQNSDLSGTEIHSDEWRGADLRNANLSGADLSQADLSLAKLSEANLSGAILNKTRLSVADLKQSDLSGASLNGSDLRRADLRQANLIEASLIDAQLRSATLQNAQLQRTRLNRADLSHADLRGVDLSHADLREACLHQTHFSGANLSHANLSGVFLQDANLERANLSDANLSEANLANTNLNGAALERVNLRNADLSNAFLRRARLSGACLWGTRLNRADLSYADLNRGDLRDCDLSDALLRHVTLVNADLTEANLNGTNLFKTDLSRAKVKGTQFRENAGFSIRTKLNLKQQGAVFE